MIVFYVMLAAIVAARVLGAAGIAALDDWHAATRAGLAVMFLFTGAAHFTSTRADLVRMVPPSLPSPGALVTLTGLAEIAGAISLLVPPLARAAALGLIVLLAAMFPANVHAWRVGHTIGGRPHKRMLVRLPLQLLWTGLLWWSTLDLAVPVVGGPH